VQHQINQVPLLYYFGPRESVGGRLNFTLGENAYGLHMHRGLPALVAWMAREHGASVRAASS